MLSGMSRSQAAGVQQAVVISAIYAIVSIATSFTFKAIFSSYKFEASFFLLGCQMCMTIAFCAFLRSFCKGTPGLEVPDVDPALVGACVTVGWPPGVGWCRLPVLASGCNALAPAHIFERCLSGTAIVAPADLFSCFASSAILPNVCSVSVQVRASVPASVAFVANIWVGWVGIKMTNIPMFLTIRRTTTFFTLIAEWYLLGKAASSTVTMGE